MSDLRELYQEVILDHGKRPRNFRELPEATHTANGYNPLCGDKLNLYLRVEEGKIADAAFQGAGCAISTASASMMTQMLKGKTLEQAQEIFDNFHRLLTGKSGVPETEAVLGKLTVFSGVGEFPARVKCATLAWHTMHAALEKKPEPVSTES